MNLLSLSGGGVRGIIASVWLQELNGKLDKPLYEVFDLIAGTSTGSILALGLAAGLNPDTFVDLYLNKAEGAFEKSKVKRFLSRLSRVFDQGFSAPKYSGEGLDKLLKDTFGNTRLKDLKTKVMIPVYSVTEHKTLVFKSWKKEHENLLVWEVARASSAAPTYLPSKVVHGHECVDGGITGMNNPSAGILAEAVRLGAKIEETTLLSVGTGEKVQNPISMEGAGIIDWAPHIVSILLDGTADSQEYIARQMLRERLITLQMEIPQQNAGLDNADRENLELLKRLAEHHIGRVQDQLDKLISLLEE